MKVVIFISRVEGRGMYTYCPLVTVGDSEVTAGVQVTASVWKVGPLLELSPNAEGTP